VFICRNAEILKGYMLICQNAKGLRRKRKVGTPAVAATYVGETRL